MVSFIVAETNHFIFCFAKMGMRVKSLITLRLPSLPEPK